MCLGAELCVPAPGGCQSHRGKRKIRKGQNDMLIVTLLLSYTVLPSFDVQLMPNKMFFHLNDESLGVDIQAR
jgi:hypothetical protein